MSQRGVGSRWSMRGLGVAIAVAALVGCATADESDGAGAKVPASSGAVARAPSSQPEQVVQRMRIDPGRPGASAAAARRVPPSEGEPRARAGVPITSKHLEAELNRLEAELGN